MREGVERFGQRCHRPGGSLVVAEVRTGKEENVKDPQPDPRGMEMYERVLGKPAPKATPDKPLAGVRELGLNHLFANIWTRPGLSIRDRRLVTLALLAAQGRTDQLRDHLRGARLGDEPLTDEEILELMVHVAHYAGWAAGASGHSAATAVFSELSS